MPPSVGPIRRPFASPHAAVAKPPERRGAILLTLRQPRTWVPIVVTHVSTVVPLADGTLRMRHATRMGSRKVRDDRVDWYVHHLREYTNWPSLGITVLYPREQGPRVSALPTALPSGRLPALVAP